MHRSRADNVQKMLGTIGQVGDKMDAQTYSEQPQYFCQQNDMAIWQLPNSRYLHKIWYKDGTASRGDAHVTKKRNPKLIRMTPAVEHREQNWVVLSDYTRHFESDLVHSSKRRQPSQQNVPNSLIRKIQHGGSLHRKMSISLGHAVYWPARQRLQDGFQPT